MSAALHQAAIPLRPPAEVMRLERLGATAPTRLSFLRILLRRAAAEAWQISRAEWALDAEGYGHAVYRVATPRRDYSLVAFSRPLPPEQRSDRVIAEAWDTSYVLYDGVPDAAEVARLADTVPRQEAARFIDRELTLARANRSVRLFDHVVARLAAGRQPDTAELARVGYLLRTTAVYGNGKFGIADRDGFADRPELAAPFQAEMLTVWLIRAFTVDLAEHCARAMAPETAVTLDRGLRRRLGVGNATGLGMAPFLVRHPLLLHRWITARETALARVRAQPHATAAQWAALHRAIAQARATVATWQTDDAEPAARVRTLGDDLHALADFVADLPADTALPWDAIFRWATATLSVEGQERIVACLIEPHGALVDDLCAGMGGDEAAGIDGRMSCTELRGLIARDHGWALALDFAAPDAQARFWYVSEEKLEPRLGERAEEPGAELEQPLTFARDVAALHAALAAEPGAMPVAAFLWRHPAHRHLAQRVQLAARHGYAEIRGNLIGAEMRPIDLLRCKLAFFGADRFDPRSDRWLRICLFQDLPFPDELHDPAWRDVL
jgi:hypothetical protein